MFHVIQLETLEPCRNETGETLVFPSGTIAAMHARDLTLKTGKKYQPRPIKSDNWRQREQARFDSGHYVKTPWHNDSVPDCAWFIGSIGMTEHYVHVSIENPGKIAFTESAEKGSADIQQRMKPGTYLKRYYSEVLSECQIQSLARSFAGQYEENVLQFATTADEIEQVYKDGPNSCMSGSLSAYHSSIHPTRVYAAGDLAVAYTTHNGDICARALCWPAKKLYTRIYGDGARLQPLLVKDGFKAGRMTGAKLLKIRDHIDPDYYVMPYIDDYQEIDDCSDHFVIGGSITADSTCGLINLEGGDDRPQCDNCGERYDDGEGFHISDRDEYFCESCADNCYQCAQTGDYFARGRNVVRMANGDYWSRDYFENHGFTCEATSENYSDDESVTMQDGTIWCQDHFARHGFQCSQCSDNFPNDEMSETRLLCESCSIDSNQHDSHCHVARQGIDNHPDQIELPVMQYRVGDIVTIKIGAPYGSGYCGPIIRVSSHQVTMPIQIRIERYEWWIYASDIESVTRVES